MWQPGMILKGSELFQRMYPYKFSATEQTQDVWKILRGVQDNELVMIVSLTQFKFDNLSKVPAQNKIWNAIFLMNGNLFTVNNCYSSITTMFVEIDVLN